MLVSQRALGARFQVLASALAGKPIVWLVFIVAMFTWPILRSIHAERGLPRTRPILGWVRDFTLRDPNGGELGAAELRGRIWVASFTAVDCEPMCVQSRRVMTKMAELRHRTRNLGDAIRLITFTVDPDRDTAARMLESSATYRASRGTWHFVSGPPAGVRDVLRNFQVAEGIPQTRLALIDGNMKIRGYYDVADEAALDVLLRDVSLLLSFGG
jgi:protein SCO1/2